jgi:hypothetical protein
VDEPATSPNDAKPWTLESDTLRHMHEATYADDAPAGYKEHQKFTKYLSDKQIEKFRKDRE